MTGGDRRGYGWPSRSGQSSYNNRQGPDRGSGWQQHQHQQQHPQERDQRNYYGHHERRDGPIRSHGRYPGRGFGGGRGDRYPRYGGQDGRYNASHRGFEQQSEISRTKRQCTDARYSETGHNSSANRSSSAAPDRSSYTSIPRKDNTSDGNIPAITTTNEEVEKTLEAKKAMMEMPIREAINFYEHLDLDTQLRMVLPEGTSVAEIPPSSQMHNQAALLKSAVNRVRDEVVPKLCIGNGHSEESDSEASDAESMASGMSFVGAPAGGNMESKQEKYVRFLDWLQYCLPLFIGFNADFIGSFGNDKWCFCPCSKHMKEWRKLFRIDDIVSSEYEKNHLQSCTFKGKMTPKSILDHFGKTQKHGGYDDLHKIMLEFVTRLYANFHGQGIPHIAFLDNNTPLYKTAQRVQAMETERVKHALVMELEKAQKELAEREREKERLDQLEKVNKDLFEQIRTLREMKEKMNVKAEDMMAVTISPSQMKSFKRSVGKVVDFTRERYGGDETGPIIVLPQRFSLNEFFQKCMNGDDAASLFYDGRLTAKKENLPAIQQIINPWEIQYESEDIGGFAVDFSEEKKRKFQIKSTPKDEGGPTRDFFNRVWTQVGSLHFPLESGNGYIELFEQTSAGFHPVGNDVIDYKLKKETEESKNRARKSIFKMYRAVGRIMAHCIVSESKGDPAPPLSIGAHALPNLYRTALFCGIEPSEEEYGVSSLIEHIFEILKNDDKAKLEEEKDIYEKIGVSGEDCTETVLRQTIQENFIDNRRIALDAMSEGLTLNGEFHLSHTLQLVPPNALASLFFAKPFINPNDFFNDDGTHRIIIAAVRGTCPKTDLETNTINQAKLMSGLGELIRSKGRDEPDFLREFLAFATGQSYIPDLDCHTFNVTIEFNFEEKKVKPWHLPIAHTCENLVKIHGSAYGGDIGVFESKLKTSMDCSKGSYNMK